MVSGVSCGMGELDRVEIIKWEGTVLEENVGYSIVTNGDFVAQSCEIACIDVVL